MYLFARIDNGETSNKRVVTRKEPSIPRSSTKRTTAAEGSVLRTSKVWTEETYALFTKQAYYYVALKVHCLHTNLLTNRRFVRTYKFVRAFVTKRSFVTQVLCVAPSAHTLFAYKARPCKKVRIKLCSALSVANLRSPMQSFALQGDALLCIQSSAL